MKSLVSAATAPETQVCVDESYAGEEAPEYAPIMSMLFGEEDEGTTGDYEEPYTDEWSEEYDPLGQYGREEDERMIAELASQVDIDMIDDSDKVGRVGVSMADNPVTGFRNLDEMIARATEAAGGSPIGQLSIMDHSSPGSQGVGNEKLTLELLQDAEVREKLAALGAQFGPDGSIELHGCRVGGDERGDEFLRQMAEVTGQRVTGGNDYQTSAMSGLEGNTKTCYPPAIDEDGNLVQTCTVDSGPMDYVWAANRALWRPSLPTSEMTPAETRILEYAAE
ncbi:MAG: DUF4347 domain-containing protein [Kofleriaceae bacterium]